MLKIQNHPPTYLTHHLPRACALTIALASALSCVTGHSEEAKNPARPTQNVPTTPAKAAPTTKPTSTTAAKGTDMRIAPALQEELKKRFTAAGAGVTAAYGLFSDGGWSNNGQVMVLLGADASGSKILIATNNKRKIEIERTPTADEWASIKSAIATATPLTDVDQQTFDALAYEYVVFNRHAGNVERGAHWYYRNPSAAPSADHLAVIKAFQSLKPKVKPAAPKK